MINGIRQWWGRYGLGLAVSSLVIGGAITLRQNNAAALVETYRWLTQPWQPRIDQEAILGTAANRELKAQVAELQYQNRELKKLLGFTEQIVGDAVPAPVIGRSADHWWQQLTLGRGQAQGIRAGDVVMAPGGLVGRVESVSLNTSRVLLISDPTSRVGVQLTRSRHMGVLRGKGNHLATLDFFDKNPKVEVGDTVVTSGLSSLYPAGVVVGKVRSVDLDASPAPRAVVELSAPIGLLEWGLIYSYAHTTPSPP